MLNDCVLVGIDGIKGTTFYFMRNDVLQDHLGPFLKCEVFFLSLKFKRKVVVLG